MLARVEEFVRGVAEKQGLLVTKIDIRPGKNKGDGFLSDIHLVNATSGDGEELAIIVKSASEDKLLVEKFHIREIFENEQQFYAKIYATFRQYQDDKGVSDAFEAVPRYFGANFDGSIRLLGLENLRNSGFELFDKKATVDGDHVEKVFKEYAKFHGVGFAYKREHRANFDEISGNLQDCWKVFMDEQTFTQMLDVVCKEIGSLLEESNADLATHFKKYENCAAAAIRDALDYKEGYLTVTHGDCWSNNFMFKYKQNENGLKKLESIRILDWQLVRLGTPVYDLSYFLYSSASKQIYDNLDHYLGVYYETFSRFVEDLGHEPEELYPFHRLKADWNKYSIFGFLLGMFLLRGKLTNDDDLRDLEDMKEIADETEFAEQIFDTKYDKELFGQRVADIVKHMVDIGVL